MAGRPWYLSCTVLPQVRGEPSDRFRHECSLPGSPAVSFDMNSRSRKDNWYYGYADDSTVLITQDVVLQQTNLLDIIAETWPGTFCSSTYGNARIDFMYASPSMMTRVVDAGFVLDKWTIPHKTPYFYDPSDHRPILVDFQL